MRSKDPDDRYDAHWISRDIEQRTLEEAMLDHVYKVFQQCSGNLMMAADILGLTRTTLYKYLKRRETMSTSEKPLRISLRRRRRENE